MLIAELTRRIYDTEDEIRRVQRAMLKKDVGIAEGREELEKFRKLLRLYKKQRKEALDRKRQVIRRLRWF